MYAEVYKWFTETSGLGLTEQAALLMNPKAASREEDIAEVIETWEEKVNRLARHGDAYRLPEAFKKVALKAMLVGKIKDNYELWEADKLSFEELLKKVKELARAKKLDTDASHGKAGVALGAADLGSPSTWSLACVAIAWAAALPTLLRVDATLEGSTTHPSEPT